MTELVNVELINTARGIIEAADGEPVNIHALVHAICLEHDLFGEFSGSDLTALEIENDTYPMYVKGKNVYTYVESEPVVIEDMPLGV